MYVLECSGTSSLYEYHAGAQDKGCSLTNEVFQQIGTEG